MTRPPGVTFLDHTADVGLAVTAPSLEALFRRAAAGTMALVRGQDDEEVAAGADARTREVGMHAAEGESGVTARDVHDLELAADDAAGLLLAWLRELLFLHQSRNADYAGATFRRLTERGLEARVVTEPGPPAVREIKGVTYHELTVEPSDDGWKAKVIFDV